METKGGNGAVEEERGEGWAAGGGQREVDGREGRDHFALPFRMAFMV